MTLNNRIDALVKLGKFLSQFANNVLNEELVKINEKSYHEFEMEIEQAFIHNPWFIREFVHDSIINIGVILQKDKLTEWVSAYNFPESIPKRVGIVMAGNIPLVGFHDMLSVLISGNIVVAKLSSKDTRLIKSIAKVLCDIQPEFSEKIIFQEENLKNIDAIIATGSNNTSRYFEYYFGKYPNVIRKNRNSIAILTGKETKNELSLLAKDIFMYFGLGCRNISKIYIPENYNLENFIPAFEAYSYFADHSKYRNNLDYNKTIYLMNKINFMDGGFFLLSENNEMASPISIIYYEYYSKKEDLLAQINLLKHSVQCIVCKDNFIPYSTSFGNAQTPELNDYADGIDTLKFLSTL